MAPDGFVRTHLVDPLAVGAPAPPAKLEDRCRMPWAGTQIEGLGLEFDADQGQQVMGLTVTSPQDLVLPLSFFPPFPFEGLGHARAEIKRASSHSRR